MTEKEITKPKRLVTDLNSLQPNYGKFTAEPLERGFGTTIGNSLRRVLLSSIQGAAIISVVIDGVRHGFSTLDGMKEDVTRVLLNLKEIRFRVHTDEIVTLVLSAEGSGNVTAADIQPNSQVEIINPDQHIATLDKCNGLNMEMQVCRGRGYELGEEHPTHNQQIGVIPVDSKFSPVRKVRCTVEETRVAHMTNYDKLILEVWTDASITAKEAVTQASDILLDQLRLYF